MDAKVGAQSRRRIAALLVLVVALLSGGCRYGGTLGADLRPVGDALVNDGPPNPEQVYQGPVGDRPLWFGLFSVDNVSQGDVIFDSIEPVRVDEGVQILGFEIYVPDNTSPAVLIDGDCGTPDRLTTFKVAGYRLAPGRTAGVVVRLVSPKVNGERGLTGLWVRYRTATDGPVFRQTFAYRAAGDHLPTGPPCVGASGRH